MDYPQDSGAAAQVKQLAEDVGRLRRRVEPDTPLYYLWERMANTLDALDAILQPSAAELVQREWPVEAALEHVEEQRRRMRAKCGVTQ